MAPRAATLFALALLATTPAAAAGWELRVCADPDNLPFSDRAGEGFDNKIAAILAEEMGADLSYVWLPDLRGRTRQRYVQGGECDMVMGVIDGQPGFLTSYAYYRTGYVFLYPDTAPFTVASLDDAVLKDLRIGLPGGTAKLVPPGWRSPTAASWRTRRISSTAGRPAPPGPRCSTPSAGARSTSPSSGARWPAPTPPPIPASPWSR